MVNLKSIACLTMGLILCFAPVAKTSAATSATVGLAAEIMVILDSTLDDRELVRSLNGRLQIQEANHVEINRMLDSMPRSFRSEVNSVNDGERIAEVRTHVRLIRDDLRIKAFRASGGLTPLTGLRLHDLQVANGNLLQSQNDLIILEIVPAMYVENALISIQQIPELEIEKERSIRLAVYQARFKQVLASSGKDSMYSKFERTDLRARALNTRWVNKLEKIRPYYEAVTYTPKHNYDCRPTRPYQVSGKVIKLREKMVDNQLDDKALAYDGLMSIYKYVLRIAQYELMFSGSHHQLEEYPQVYRYNEHSNNFGSLQQKVELIIEHIPATDFLDCDPTYRTHHRARV